MIRSIFKPREARQTVALAVRLRVDHDWEDARICNISSRGMMIACRTSFPRSAIVEIRRGQAIAIGRVVWSRSEHFGLRLQDRIRIEDFIEAKASGPRRDENGELRERRSTPRGVVDDAYGRSRFQASAAQFVGAVSFAVAGGGLIVIVVSELMGAVSQAVAGALL